MIFPSASGAGLSASGSLRIHAVTPWASESVGGVDKEDVVWGGPSAAQVAGHAPLAPRLRCYLGERYGSSALSPFATLD